MALELVGGAVLGVALDQFRNEIWRLKENDAMFKSRLEELQETLGVLSPVIQEIEELNRRLNDRSDHGRETIVLRGLLEDGKKLVSKCSKIPRWDILKRGRHREKLVELENKMLRFHSLHMQAHMARDQKQTLLFVQEMRQLMIMSLNQQQGDSSNLTMALTASPSMDLNQQQGDSSNLTMALTASRSMDLNQQQGDSSNLTMALTASPSMDLNQQQGDSSNLTMALTASPSIDSSDLTMSLTAYSTDPLHKVQRRLVLKVRGRRCRNKPVLADYSAPRVDDEDIIW